MINSSEILELLQKYVQDIKLTENTDIFNECSMDSFTVFSKLLPELLERYNIEIAPNELIPENFESAAAITRYINSKKGN